MRTVRRTEFGKPLTAIERVLMFLVYWLGTFCYRLLCATYRVRERGPENRAFAYRERGYIGVMWHQRLFCTPYIVKRVPNLAFLVSQSKDGEMIRYVLEGLGFKAIQGSSSRRGGAAYREMSAHFESGGIVAITPDGPRGPARRVQPGAPRLAVEKGLTLLPSSIAARKFWILPSWDRFLFPKPFTEVFFHWGTPIAVKKGGGPEEVERVARLLEESLDRLTEKADREAGHAPLPRASERGRIRSCR